MGITIYFKMQAYQMQLLVSCFHEHKTIMKAFFFNFTVFITLSASEKSLWRLEETCCNSNFSERPSADIDVKNSKGV